jgi:hypothetical protein
MFDFLKKLAIVFALTIAFPLLSGQQLAEVGAPPTSSPSTSQAKDASVFQWAWEFPAYTDNYPQLKKTCWLEPNCVGELLISLQQRRDEDKVDRYSGFSYTAIRPFLLDFRSFSCAFGISYIGTTFESDTDDKYSSAQSGPLTVYKSADDFASEGVQQTLNFSSLWSFPEISLQVILDVGYAWSTIRTKMDVLTLDGSGILIGVLDNYEYLQRDEGTFLGINVLKSFAWGDYLNFFHLFLYAGIREKTVVRESSATLSSTFTPIGSTINSGKQDLPFNDGQFAFPDPQPSKKFNLTFVGYNLDVRLFTIYTSLMENRGLSLSLFSCVQHFTGEIFSDDYYGTRTKLGSTVSIFDGVTIRTAYIWERGNDQNDGFEVTISIRVFGIINELLKGKS